MTYEEFVEKNVLNYKILEMKFKQGKTHSEIAAALNKSTLAIGKYYRAFTWNLYICYFRYLKSIGLKVDAADIKDFYESSPHSVSYLEQIYSEELYAFRKGKPPVLLGIIKNSPSYRKLTDEQVLALEQRIVKARECERRTFLDIGKEFDITWEKARCLYKHHYHRKVMAALDKIKEHTGEDLSTYIFKYSPYPYKRWLLIVKDYPSFVQDLIDT